MNKVVLTVTLNPAVDVTTAVARFQPRRTFRECPQFINAGGKGINVSRILHRLGVQTLAIGIAGGQAGEWIQGLLNEEGIPNEFVKAGGESRMNLTILDTQSGIRTRLLSVGPRLKAQEIKNFQKLYKRRIRRSAMVVLSGRNALGAPEDFYARLIRLAKRSQVPAVLDTSGVPFKKALEAAPFMVKPNLTEAREVLECRLDTAAKIKKAVERFHRFGVEIVVISMNKDGAVVSGGRGIRRIRPPRVTVRNDVGCGDALIGGFLDGYLRGMSLEDTLRRAVACAAANAGNWTPGLIRRADLIKLSRGVRLEPL